VTWIPASPAWVRRSISSPADAEPGEIVWLNLATHTFVAGPPWTFATAAPQGYGWVDDVPGQLRNGPWTNDGCTLVFVPGPPPPANTKDGYFPQWGGRLFAGPLWGSDWVWQPPGPPNPKTRPSAPPIDPPIED
jgi:hypothetical protein